jgi:hypothetical protein
MSRLEAALKKSIVTYLEERGISYERVSGNNYYYYSPFKSENTPSFCVNIGKYDKNVWKDFSTGDKLGDIVDLVQKLERVSTSDAISIILEDSCGHEDKFNKGPEKNNKPQILISELEQLTSDRLITYIADRRVNVDIAKKYCKQAFVSFPSSKHPDRTHRCIVFSNSKGGHELRNPYLKVSTSPKMFTEIKDYYAKATMITDVWEGFMDFLSYLTYMKWDKPKYRTIILNGLCNLPYIDFSREKHHMYIDNDIPAERELYKLRKQGIKYEDKRKIFEGYKDFNLALTNGFQLTKELSRTRGNIRRLLLD